MALPSITNLAISQSISHFTPKPELCVTHKKPLTVLRIPNALYPNNQNNHTPYTFHALLHIHNNHFSYLLQTNCTNQYRILQYEHTCPYKKTLSIPYQKYTYFVSKTMPPQAKQIPSTLSQYIRLTTILYGFCTDNPVYFQYRSIFYFVCIENYHLH